jgi:hypothetical protein
LTAIEGGSCLNLSAFFQLPDCSLVSAAGIVPVARGGKCDAGGRIHDVGRQREHDCRQLKKAEEEETI